jgi:hypothetical protein
MFADMKTLLYLANASNGRSLDEFVLPTNEMLRSEGWLKTYSPFQQFIGLNQQQGLRRLCAAADDLGFAIPEVETMLAVCKGVPRETWAQGLALRST